MATIEEFSTLDLRVGAVVRAERITGSDKLLRLEVDIGETSGDLTVLRQIVAGIGLAYEPEAIIGKQIIVIANLEPRKLMGVESQGMLLAASDGSPVLLTTEKPVSPGSKIR